MAPRRRLAPWLLALSLSTGCVHCYGPGGGGGTDTPARLRVRPVPADATVTLDDETVLDGRVIAAEAVELPAGRHLITVEATGYYPHDLALDLPSGETAVDVRLRPLPP